MQTSPIKGMFFRLCCLATGLNPRPYAGGVVGALDFASPWYCRKRPGIVVDCVCGRSQANCRRLGRADGAECPISESIIRQVENPIPIEVYGVLNLTSSVAGGNAVQDGHSYTGIRKSNRPSRGLDTDILSRHGFFASASAIQEDHCSKYSLKSGCMDCTNLPALHVTELLSSAPLTARQLIDLPARYAPRNQANFRCSHP